MARHGLTHRRATYYATRRPAPPVRPPKSPQIAATSRARDYHRSPMRPTGTASGDPGGVGASRVSRPRPPPTGSTSAARHLIRGLDGSGGGQLEHRGGLDSRLRRDGDRPRRRKDLLGQRSRRQSTISVANLDGSGGMDLPITGAPLNKPYGVALDLGAGRIYWANYQGPATERIGYANLDGSGGGFLNTTGATAEQPDRGRDRPRRADGSTGRTRTEKISYANLDGSGGADINTTGATTGGIPSEGVAIDRAGGRIYWVSYRDRDSVSPPTSPTPDSTAAAAATSRRPSRTAPFPGESRSTRQRAGSTGPTTPQASAPPRSRLPALTAAAASDLDLDGAPSQTARLPTLLKAPVGTGAPKLTAQIALRPRFLTCDEGTWAGDMPEAQLYRAPHSFSYQWTKDGQPIPGATRSDIGVEGTGGGDYACQVTATNAGGSTTQTSRTQFVCCPPSPQATAARVVLVKRGRARLKLTCPAGARTVRRQAAVRPAHLGKRVTCRGTRTDLRPRRLLDHRRQRRCGRGQAQPGRERGSGEVKAPPLKAQPRRHRRRTPHRPPQAREAEGGSGASRTAAAAARAARA